jgi:hypothetical protein
MPLRFMQLNKPGLSNEEAGFDQCFGFVSTSLVEENCKIVVRNFHFKQRSRAMSVTSVKQQKCKIGVIRRLMRVRISVYMNGSGFNLNPFPVSSHC